MEAVLSDPGERNHRIYNIPLSAIMQDGKKIKYFDYISSLQNEDCNRALKRIIPRIDMEKIKEIIDHTPFISNLQKDFYLTMLTERKTHILDFSLTALMKKERSIQSKKNNRR